ncbi:MAG: carbon-nitrogen hydrolase [Marinilabiliales bacterium]|nr:MAG: carbon-nitrogen hydrolase [Marinilabiliales bacterium]
MFKLAQIQFAPLLGDINTNCEKAEKLISQCNDSQLIVLPEVSDTGYNFPNRKYAFDLAYDIEENPFVKMLLRKSREMNTSIVSGICEKVDDKLYNSSILVSKGNILGTYRKIHLFMNEKDIFEPGVGGLEVYEIEGVNIGILICFDYLFPEIWRILAQKNADIIAHPSNLVTYNAFKVVPAQAIINKVFIATTNRIGTERDLTFAGRSFMCQPDGKIIKEAGKETEEIIKSNVDVKLARDKMITSRNHVFNDLKPESYF